MLRLYPAMLRNNVWQFAPSICLEEIALRHARGRSSMPVLNGHRTRGSLDVLPKLWVENRGRSPAWVGTVFGGSSIAVAALVAVVLNLVLPRQK